MIVPVSCDLMMKILQEQTIWNRNLLKVTHVSSGTVNWFSRNILLKKFPVCTCNMNLTCDCFKRATRPEWNCFPPQNLSLPWYRHISRSCAYLTFLMKYLACMTTYLLFWVVLCVFISTQACKYTDKITTNICLGITLFSYFSKIMAK